MTDATPALAPAPTTTPTRHPGLGRRKACDLCNSKKIKCDVKKPHCSHCVLYKTNCTFTPQPRRRPKDQRAAQKDSTQNPGQNKDRPSQAEKKRTRDDGSNPKRPTTTNGSAPPGATGPRTWTMDIERDGNFNELYSFTSLDAAIEITLDETPCLPPLHETLPIVETYFSHVNSAMPLFHEGKFMSLLWAWYAETKGRQKSSDWAAINVVLALSLWHDVSRKTPDDDALMCQCIKNAQTALNVSTLKEHTLLDLQIVLGLAMLFQAGPNPRPTSMLTAMAVRMAHRLRLHTKSPMTTCDASTAWERDRVFWIVFVLDRDISLRLRDPYHQQDHDMDVDLPEFKTIDENAGIVLGNDGNTWLNFLLCRIDLARIQGKAYDTMFSVQGERLGDLQRQAARLELISLLREWKESIPPQFQPEVLASNTFPVSLRFLALLHFSYYHCLYLVCGIFCHDSGWIRRLTSYSDRYAIESSRPNPGSDFASSLPSNWFEDVDASRVCMRLFHVVDSKDLALLGNMSCTYMSAMIVLIANKLTSAEHSFSDQVEEDDLLIDEGLDFIDQMARALDDDRLRRLCAGSHELNARATNAVMSSRFGGTWKSKVHLRPWPSLEDFYDTTTPERVVSKEKDKEPDAFYEMFARASQSLQNEHYESNLAYWPSQHARLDDLGIAELSRSADACTMPHYLGLIP